MGTFRRAFLVPTDPADTLDYLQDYGHTVTWDPATIRCTRGDAAPIAVGSTWTNVSTFRGREAVLDYTLVERTDRRVRFEGSGRGARASDDFTVEAAKAGGTRVDYRAVIDLKTWRKAADPFLRRVYEEMGEGAVQGIRRELGGR